MRTKTFLGWHYSAYYTSSDFTKTRDRGEGGIEEIKSFEVDTRFKFLFR
jgi:hypothetical protein